MSRKKVEAGAMATEIAFTPARDDAGDYDSPLKNEKC